MNEKKKWSKLENLRRHMVRVNMHLKKFSASLATRKIKKSKTILRVHLIQVRMIIIKKTSANKCIENVEKERPSFNIGDNVNCRNHYESIWRYF